MSSNSSKKSILTDIFFAFYVSIGFLLMIIASLMSTSSLFDVFKNDITAWIVYLVCTILAGAATLFTKRRIYKGERKLFKNSNIILREDWFPLIYTLFLIVLEYIIITFIPSFNLMYTLILMVMIAIVGLNIYFDSFWRLDLVGSGKNSNLEALKLQHHECSTMFNNIVIGSLVVIAGMVFSLFTNYFEIISKESIFYPFNLYADGFLIFHVIAVGPLVWLLRPVHNKMVYIRKKIIELN